MNILIALMNLEHAYGTEESPQDVIDQALSALNQVKVYRHLVSMHKTPQAASRSVTYFPQKDRIVTRTLTYNFACTTQPKQ